jgi:hypothetical protein
MPNIHSLDDFLSTSTGMLMLDGVCMNLFAVKRRFIKVAINKNITGHTLFAEKELIFREILLSGRGFSRKSRGLVINC